MDCGPRRRFNLRIFGGSSHPELTKLVAKKVGVRVGQNKLKKFANKETSVELSENCRGHDIYVMQSGGGESPNDNLMELLFLVNAFRLAAARKITVITPYFPYSKGDQKDGQRVPISSKLVADLLKMAGAKHLMMLDPHTPQLEGFFGTPVDALKVEPFFCEWIKKNILHWEECIVVSPDEGGVKKSVLVANDLNLDFALIHNRNKPNKMYSKPETQLNGEPVAAVAASAEDDGARAELAALPEHKGLEMVKEDEERSRHTSSSQSSSGRSTTATFERHGALSGSVSGRTVIMIDDMIDTGGTLKFAAAVLEREGADNCYMLASHGVFSKGSMEAVAGIKKDFLSAVVVTNSIPQEANKAAIAADFHVIDISGLIAEFVRRHHYHESVSVLSQFQPIRDEPNRMLRSMTRGLSLGGAVAASEDWVTDEPASDVAPDGTVGVPPRYGFRMRSMCWE